MEWVVPAAALLLLIWAVFVHRQLVALREDAVEAWAEIDAQFQQRQGLVPRLLEMIEGHLAPDAKSVRALIDARRLAGNAHSPDAIGKAEAVLGAAIEKVLALGAQAGLKADAGFIRLRAEFSEMENRIEALRRSFNDAVEVYNAARIGFPAAFLTYVISFPQLEGLGVPKAVVPRAGRAVERL